MHVNMVRYEQTIIEKMSREPKVEFRKCFYFLKVTLLKINLDIRINKERWERIFRKIK
jgi:hypothetical protein